MDAEGSSRMNAERAAGNAAVDRTVGKIRVGEEERAERGAAVHELWARQSVTV